MGRLPKNKYALLIATTLYKDRDLRQLAAPGADVQALADVLGNPRIGGFKVETLVNRAWWEAQEAIARFFANRDSQDLLLLYFSCHGVKKDDGHLYFAMADTDKEMPRASAVPDDFVQETMGISRAGQQILILDCCYGGSFTSRMLSKADSTVDDIDRFQAHGAVVLTGSNAIQYAFEGDGFENDSKLSVFTSHLVKGLSSGDADLDEDGQISAADLFGYARRQMRSEARTQTPTLSTIGQEGEIYIAEVPTSKRRKRQMGAPVRASADGWVDLTRYLSRSPEAANRDAVLIAMQMSLAFHGKRVSLSSTDLHAKLTKLTKLKPDQVGFVVQDMISVIDHVGVQAERSKKVYTARSVHLTALDDIVGQLRLGRPVVAGFTWRKGWLEAPISKTGKLDLGVENTIAGGRMITIVGCNEGDLSMRFMFQLGWGDRGLGWMTKATAAASIHSALYSIEAAEMTMPFTRA